MSPGGHRTATETLPTVSESVDAGTRIGKYTLIAKVGHGGMAEVFLAAIRGPGGFTKLCVLKRLHAHLEDDPDLVGMFFDEARLAARLSHPNVVQTYEVSDSGGSRFLTMEFLEGQPLSRLLNRLRETRESLPLSVGVQLFIDALDGLTYAHTLRDFDGTPFNVVHRDVSPSNIFVTYDGQVKLLDFGIAKAGTQLNETKAGQVKGKFAYVAPEQAQPGEHDHRVDVWSLGVVMWEAFTGKRLFKGESEIATLHNALTSEIPLLDTVCNVPLGLARIVDRALRRDPSSRYQSARQMKEDLEDFMVDQGLRASRRDTGALITELFARERDEQHRVLSAYLRGETLTDVTFEAAPTSAYTTEHDLSGARLRSLSGFVSSTQTTPSRRLFWASLVFLLASAAGAGAALWLTWDAPPQSATLDDHSGAIVEVDSREPTPPPSASENADSVRPIPHEAPPEAGVNAHEIPLEPPVEDSVAGAAADLRRMGPDEPSPNEPSPSQPSSGQSSPRQPSEVAETRSATAMRRAAPRARGRRAPRVRSPTATAPVMPTAIDEVEVEEGSAATDPVGSGFLTFDTVPWSHVSVNGRRLGTTPLIRQQLPAGTHVLTLVNPEREIHSSFQITIVDGELVTKRIALE